MYFKRFEIYNFKGIDEVKIDLVSNSSRAIHTLVGLNESGKTTILEAIDLFKGRESGQFEVETILDSAEKNNVASYVPKKHKANFNDEIKIVAHLGFEGDDKEGLNDYLATKFKFKPSTENLNSDELKVEKVFSFEASENTTSSSLWSFHLHGRTGRQQSERPFGADDDVWQSAASFMQTNLFPKITYFPTFLFDFPQKIFIGESENESPENAFYRKVMQDVLDSLDEELNLQDHIINRLEETFTDTNGEKKQRISRKSYTGDMEERINAVLDKMSDKITREIFSNWYQTFKNKKSVPSMKIEIKLKFLEEDNSKEVAYIEFQVKNNNETFALGDQSLGFQWFFCYFLFTHFRGFREGSGNVLFLFDEPASNLHTTAQEKLLENFPKIGNSSEAENSHQCGIIFSTHSSYMINPKWLEKAYIVENKALNYENDEYDNYQDYNDLNASITATPYRKFVNENPGKTSYFQPILDSLEYRPSKLESTGKVVLVEGKSDFYTFDYFKKNSVLADELSDIHFIPGVSGAHKLNIMIALQLGWGRDFIVLLDGDTAGKKAKAKYIEDFHFNDGKVFCLDDVDPNFNNTKLENLFSENMKNEIAPAGNKSEFKKTLARRILESTRTDDSLDIDDETRENFEKVLDFCLKRFDD